MNKSKQKQKGSDSPSTRLAKKSTALMISILLLGPIISIIWALLRQEKAALFSSDSTEWALAWFPAVPTLAVHYCLVMCMWHCQGWKTRKLRTLLGLPVRLWFVYLIILGILHVMKESNDQLTMFPSAQAYIYSFIAGALIGVLGSLILWFGGYKSLMAYSSEYDIRQQLKEQGKFDSDIDDEAQSLKVKGTISA